MTLHEPSLESAESPAAFEPSQCPGLSAGLASAHHVLKRQRLVARPDIATLKLAIRLLAFSVGLFLSASALHADDWPQWLGPQRDGVWRETGIMETLPANGFTYRWRTPIGGGYSGPAVAKGRVYVMDRQLATGTKNPSDAFARGESGISLGAADKLATYIGLKLHSATRKAATKAAPKRK